MQQIEPEKPSGSTERLRTCPDCGLENLTGKGLVAHRGGTRCKELQAQRNAISPVEPEQPASSVQPVTLALQDQLPAVPQPNTLAPTDEDTILGAQLTHQYERAIGGIREVLVFGGMMLKLEHHVTVSARGHGGKFGNKGDGMKAWLEQYAPKVSRPTAYRFRDIAEGLRKEFSLGAKVDLQWLLTTPAEEITDEELRAKREKIFEFIEGKSQRQLLLAFEKGEHGAGGGHDPKKDKKKELTPEEQEEACLAACLDDVKAFAKRGTLLGQKYTAPNITDAERDALIDLLRSLASEIEAYNKTPVHQRTSVSGVKLLAGTSEE